MTRQPTRRASLRRIYTSCWSNWSEIGVELCRKTTMIIAEHFLQTHKQYKSVVVWIFAYVVQFSVCLVLIFILLSKNLVCCELMQS